MQEEYMILQAQLPFLNSNEKRIFELCMEDGHDFQSIAEHEGMQVESVRSRVWQIQKKISYGVFAEGGTADFGELLYYAENQDQKFSLQCRAAENHIGNWSYILPMKNAVNIPEILPGEWKNFFNKCDSAGDYEVIVIDLNDAVQGVTELLEECDQIYMITPKEAAALKKIQQFEEMLKKKNLDHLWERIVRMQVPLIDKLQSDNKNLKTENKKLQKALNKKDIAFL